MERGGDDQLGWIREEEEARGHSEVGPASAGGLAARSRSGLESSEKSKTEFEGAQNGIRGSTKRPRRVYREGP